jgi:hypothetical protein
MIKSITATVAAFLRRSQKGWQIMKRKSLFALAICLAFIVLVSGCSGGGHSPAIDLQQAQLGWAAAMVVGADGSLISSGMTAWVDNGTVGNDMKRKNPAGTLTLDLNPSDGSYTNTMTLTASGYLESQTGYTLDGTIVGVSTDPTHSTLTFNLTLSHPTLRVTSITGTLNQVSSVSSGSLSFNGDPYTYAQLMSH